MATRTSHRPSTEFGGRIGRHDLLRFVERAAAAIERESAYLNRLDAALGDGDHGENMPLYGTAFIEAGLAVRGSFELDLEGLARAFDAATRGLARRGRCSVGDKTILDALEPASRSLAGSAETGEALGRALPRAAWAARRGMLSTVPLIARRGLALRLGERSRGHQDPGATSCYLLVRALDPRSHHPLARGHR